MIALRKAAEVIRIMKPLRDRVPMGEVLVFCGEQARPIYGRTQENCCHHFSNSGSGFAKISTKIILATFRKAFFCCISSIHLYVIALFIAVILSIFNLLSSAKRVILLLNIWLVSSFAAAYRSRDTEYFVSGQNIEACFL